MFVTAAIWATETADPRSEEVHPCVFAVAVVWSKGDVCLAPWSQDGDDQLYKAHIKAFKGTGCRRKAVVSYDGYDGSSDKEIALKVK